MILAVFVLLIVVATSVASLPSPLSTLKSTIVLAAAKTESNKPVVLKSTLNKKNSGNKSIKLTTPKKVSLNAFDLCICGALATAFGDFVMHPVDTIKVLQQTSTTAKSMFMVAKELFASKGMSGFYSGVVPYMTADGLSGAIKFASFEISKVFVEARVPSKYHYLTQFACAAMAMLACSVVMVPGEVLKTRMQAGVTTSLISGITDTLKNEGIGGLFSGYYATLVRDVPYTMLELGLYENIKTFLRKYKKTDTLTQTEELTAAAITGGITGFLTTPLDLIKTRLMIQSSTGGQYSGIVDALSSIYQSGGVEALFTGSAARVAWLLPFTTIYLGVYEVAKRKILEMKQKKADASLDN